MRPYEEAVIWRVTWRRHGDTTFFIVLTLRGSRCQAASPLVDKVGIIVSSSLSRGSMACRSCGGAKPCGDARLPRWRKW